MTDEAPRIGVIGVGRMGQPICARLVSSGRAVTATDVRGDVAVTKTGARWAGSASEVARGSSVLLTVLPGCQQVEAVREELLTALPRGATWIDLSTSTPAVSRENARLAIEHGITVLDAPMGGGPPEAAGGRLVLFVGGAADDLHAHRGILETLADRVLHVGEAGAGCAVKLMVNLLWFGQAVAGAEVLSLAARAGLDPEVVRCAVQHSAAAARFMDGDARALLQGDDLTSFSITGCLEELTAVLALGRELEVPLALAQRVTDLYAEAVDHYGPVDGELLAARLVTERANVSFGQATTQGRRELRRI